MKHRFAILVLVVVLASSALGGILGKSAASKQEPAQAAPERFLASFTEALDVIQRNYVENVGTDALVYSAMKNMLHRLDPHSSFFDPKEYARMREEQESRFYGLGIHVRTLTSNRGPVAIAAPPEEGTPAKRSGLRAGDVITRIDNESIDDWSLDEVINHLRGPRRSEVNITVERYGVKDPMQFTVVRDEVPLKTISYAFEIKPGIGYIRIERFAESTADELRKKLSELGSDSLAGLILDLRDNPGGLLNKAIDVADMFVPRGALIVSTKGRIEGSDQSYRARGRKKLDIPLVVLINHGSASASEIVAGALQDHDRALIVGETSFGKGLVQTVYPLGNDTGMALTTARYYTPSGRLIQRSYSHSSFEYYYIDAGADNLAEAGTDKKEIRHTDSGRPVYGGGGITPDVIEKPPELNRFEALLASRDVFFRFARHLILDDAQRDPVVTESAMAEFEQFLRNQQIAFTAQDFQQNSEFIKRGIRQFVATSVSGLQEGYRIQVQGDTLVQKALELMPQAKALMAARHVAREKSDL